MSGLPFRFLVLGLFWSSWHNLPFTILTLVTNHAALPQARLHLRHPRRAVRHAARRAAHRPRQHTAFSQVSN